MSDDKAGDVFPPETGTPLMTPMELREHVRRLREEADVRQREREERESAASLEAIRETAERTIAAMRELPCRGAVKSVGECSADFHVTCERRESPSCPRRIVELDRMQEAQERRERLRSNKIPERVRRACLDEFYVTPETQAVDEWLASGKAMLLLVGPRGTGKSVAAGYALVRRFGQWAHVSEVADVYGLDRAAVVTRLKKARFLVLDDLGAEQTSEGAKAAITSILLVRFEECLPTVMTSNLDAKAWKAYVDERISDRLAGDGMVYGSTGPSRRRAK